MRTLPDGTLLPDPGEVPRWDGTRWIYTPPIPGPRGKGGGSGSPGPAGPPGPSGVGGPPSGPAGGDLSGTYPNPSVDGLQTVPVSPAAPTPGDVLTLVAGTWTPQAPTGGAPSGAAGGDLNGTYPNPTVDGLQGVAVSAAAPVNGNVLTLVGGVWTPAASAGGAPSGAAGGDLNGTYPNPTVDGLQGVAVSAAAPVNGNVLTLVGGVWTPAASAGGAPSGAAGGDLNGSYPNPTVDGLQGVAVSATAPTDGDIWVYDGTSWKLSGTNAAGDLVLLTTGATAATFAWGQAATAVVVRQQTRTSDVLPSQLTISSQAPFAAATGLNRTPGTLLLEVPAAVAGGTEGKLQLGIGATDGAYFQAGVLGPGTAGMFLEREFIIIGAAVGPGTGGHNLIVSAGSSGITGARSQGGELGLQGGNADGTTGAAAQGGAIRATAGEGSTASGTGGDIQIISGDGGTPDGNAGVIEIGTGLHPGTGARGEIRFTQSKSVNIVGYFATNGQLHVGADADVSGVNFRVNGAVQTTVGAAGAATALPALPTGYWHLSINGVDRVVPYYAQA